MHTTKILITTDVEIWPESWDRIGSDDFQASFRKYIYGDTPRGSFGLPFQMQVLDDHGLSGVFMVESLFACGFGLDPLAEIIGLIQDRGHEVQMHAHAEWVDKFDPPILPDRHGHHFYQYNRADQLYLLTLAHNNLLKAGVSELQAFRAGSYGANNETLLSLGELGILFDSSYNRPYLNTTCQVFADSPIRQPRQMDSVWEIPVTYFQDGLGRLRPFQINGGSLAELIQVLEQAYAFEAETVVLVSHGFELLTPSKRRHDPFALRRFIGLARYLDQHRNRFITCGFKDLQFTRSDGIAWDTDIHTTMMPALGRYLEQVARRCLT